MIVGILGGGQLARMMVLAGTPLGLRFVVLDPAPDACAGQVAPQIVAAYDDRDGLLQLAERADVITFDFENVPASSAQLLSERLPIFPPPRALDVAQDRLSEKQLFASLGIETAPHAAVGRLDELERAVVELGFPAVLKTRRLGYDGKGQRVLRRPRDVESAWRELGSAPLILEGFVDFDGEVSMLAARSTAGEQRFYPLTRNRHSDGILRFSQPAPPPASWQGPGLPDLESRARDAAARVLDALDYVGLLAIEFFVAEGRLIANEMAPRVHNSGHWTQDGAVTCQFENHLRAGLGLPLGETSLRGPVAMVNLIGD
ncbi:MAG: 5-(carboxyamino)imidazole ribonucleotide synthase, partial [Acidobacteriota bacterium]